MRETAEGSGERSAVRERVDEMVKEPLATLRFGAASCPTGLPSLCSAVPDERSWAL